MHSARLEWRCHGQTSLGRFPARLLRAAILHMGHRHGHCATRISFALLAHARPRAPPPSSKAFEPGFRSWARRHSRIPLTAARQFSFSCDHHRRKRALLRMRALALWVACHRYANRHVSPRRGAHCGPIGHVDNVSANQANECRSPGRMSGSVLHRFVRIDESPCHQTRRRTLPHLQHRPHNPVRISDRKSVCGRNSHIHAGRGHPLGIFLVYSRLHAVGVRRPCCMPCVFRHVTRARERSAAGGSCPSRIRPPRHRHTVYCHCA